MATRTCAECSAVYAVGVRKCPQCGTAKGFETGGKDDPSSSPVEDVVESTAPEGGAAE